MKKVYRQPKTKSVNLRTESLMDGDGDVHFGLVTPSSTVPQGGSGMSKRQGNTIFDDLFDKVESPADMTVEENDYSTHTTIE